MQHWLGHQAHGPKVTWNVLARVQALSLTHGVYVSRLVAFSRACSDFKDINERHKKLAQKLCQQGLKKKRIQNTFCKFAQNHKNLVSKYQTDLQAHT